METMKNRARRKAMNLLRYRDHTEKELRLKLMRAGFGEEESEEAIRYVKNYGYIDDERYAGYYMELNKDRKSRSRICYDLEKRGIKRGTIAKVMEGYSGEDAAFLKAMDKKIRQLGEPVTMDKRNQLTTYLYRQGFGKDTIDKHLRNEI